MKTLARDQRGAIMVLGVFMAVLLTAVVYYVVGIGETVWQRERMQDAADAAAYSAAVVHARGMNLIALINMVMAALLAVLVALKLVQTLVGLAIVLIAIASFFNPGLAGVIPDLAIAAKRVGELHARLRPPIHASLQALHVAARAVRVVVPAASEAAVVGLVLADYRPPASAGAAVLPRLTLPTQDGTFKELCDESSEYVGDFVDLALAPLPLGGIDLGDAVRDLTSAGSEWFCGASGRKPPKTTVTHKEHYPKLPSRVRCESFDPGRPEYDATEHTRACEQAERDELAAKADESTGSCLHDCARGGLYEQATSLARAACAPRRHHDKRLRGFRWQERRFEREYEYQRGRWRAVSDAAQEQRTERLTRKEGRRRPCGEVSSPVSRDWNAEPFDADGAFTPVCSNAAPPTRLGNRGERVTLEHVEVVHVLSCRESYEKTYELSEQDQNDRVGDSTSKQASQQARKVPQVLLPSLELGQDDFQLRSVVVGALPPSGPHRVMRVATWGHAGEGLPELWATGRALGRLSIAQAEYFYAVETRDRPDPQSFLWNMRWQARLRRFRMPQKEPDRSLDREDVARFGTPAGLDSLSSVCSKLAGDPEKGGSTCAALDPSWQDLIAH